MIDNLETEQSRLIAEQVASDRAKMQARQAAEVARKIQQEKTDAYVKEYNAEVQKVQARLLRLWSFLGNRAGDRVIYFENGHVMRGCFDTSPGAFVRPFGAVLSEIETVGIGDEKK